MKQSFLKLTLAALAGVAFWAISPLSASATAGNPAWQQEGEAIYSKSCASCHGADGKAQTPKGQRLSATNFTNPKWQTNTSDAKITKTITNGRGAMPDYKKALSEDEIKAVAAYLRGFKP